MYVGSGSVDQLVEGLSTIYEPQVQSPVPTRDPVPHKQNGTAGMVHLLKKLVGQLAI